MHRKFRSLLDGAVGESKLVVVVNLDIRGFSDWSKTVDSAETALYIKRVYATLIDDYFPDPTFVTSTGDGLLVVIPYDEEELTKTVRRTVADCMKIVTRFPKLCHGDPVINFEVPTEIGIGIARGSAARIVNEGETLDYSGIVLSVATRVMDLARPKGVVLDESLGSELLTKAVREKFHDGKAYLKGVSPTTPRSVLMWPSSVHVPESNSHPVGKEIWKTSKLKGPLSDLEANQTSIYRADLPQRPVGDEEGVVLRVTHPGVIGAGRKSKSGFNRFRFPFTLENAGGDHFVTYDKDKLVETLIAGGVKSNWEVLIEVKYRAL
jgi:class 3 adenylate cyclase